MPTSKKPFIAVDRERLSAGAQAVRTRSAGFRHRWARHAFVSTFFGALGAFLVLLAFGNYFSLGKSHSSQVVLQESSAIIDVVNQVGPSVVNITTEQVKTSPFGFQTAINGAGSGIVIKSDGLILTNKHVVAGADAITVTTPDHQTFKHARVLGLDPINDIAFVKVDASGLPAATLGDSDQVVVGQRAIAIGNALGEFDNTVTDGIISGVGRPVVAGSGATEQESLRDLLQTDAAINPGNSGGPLVNVEGQVIGIDTAIATDAQGIGFAIPINQAKADITSIERSNKLAKAYLGIRYVTITDSLKAANHLPLSQGAYLIGNGAQPAIVPGSPAAKAGLKAKDIITKVDADDLTDKRGLATLLGRHLPGDSVKLTILRDGKTIEVTVTLGTLPSG